MLIDDARLILAAWRERLVSDDDVRAWSYKALETIPAADLPEWLLNLSTHGPSTCMARPSSDFLDVPHLDYASGFSLRVRTCNFADASDVEAFIAWASSACLGENHSRPEVQFGYQLDHCLNDCARLDWAKDLVDKELPNLQEHLVPIEEEVVQLVRHSKSRKQGDSSDPA